MKGRGIDVLLVMSIIWGRFIGTARAILFMSLPVEYRQHARVLRCDELNQTCSGYTQVDSPTVEFDGQVPMF
jgi:hypothetical protein